jgi:Kdo2-lipid IVA lauroyltransferase/acyltransferase
LDTTLLGKERADIEELARSYTKVLERYIYQYPEEWFWLHNRWKNGGENERVLDLDKKDTIQ